MYFSVAYTKVYGAWYFPQSLHVCLHVEPFNLRKTCKLITIRNEIAGAFFTTYEGVKSTLHNSSTNKTSSGQSSPFIQSSQTSLRLPFTHSLPTPIIHAIASSTAEMVSCLILTPAEVLKQNAQMVQANQKGLAKSNVTAMRQVLSRFKAHPWRLWSGYTALVGRNLPFTGLQFPLFEYVRSHAIDWRRQRIARLGKQSGSKPPSEIKEQLIQRAGLTGVSASVAGLVASTVTTPIDVVKTRVMLSAIEEGGSTIKGEKGRVRQSVSVGKRGTFEVGRAILRQEGVRGLFKGGAIRAGWTAVSMSLYLSLYEGGRFYLENRRKTMEGVT